MFQGTLSTLDRMLCFFDLVEMDDCFLCLKETCARYWETICESSTAILHIEIMGRNMRRGITAEMIKAVVRFANSRPGPLTWPRVLLGSREHSVRKRSPASLQYSQSALTS